MPEGKEPPYVLCSRHPDGEIAVATVPRNLGVSGRAVISFPLADVSLQVGELNRPVGIFGEYASLTLVSTGDLGGRRILAQDLAGTTPVDITSEVKVSDGRLTIPGMVIHRVGLMAAKPGDISDPGLVLAIPGLTKFVAKPAMTPGRNPDRPKPAAEAGAGLKVTRAIWGAVPGGLGLGPMAVVPEHQRRGIGGRLMRAGLERCRALGVPWIIVLGHPSYYPRFGFMPASRFGVRCLYPAPDEAFMALELMPDALRGATGTVHYEPDFEGV
jgi:GNAT superfamily N-acetyltransferase